MREPLLLPMIAIAGGIVLGQGVAFGVRDAAVPCALFAGLAMLPVSAWLRRVNLGLCLLFAGVFLDAVHRPTRVPVIDAPPRETVVASGCVVEPTVFSEDRAQFVLELEPGARVQVQVPKYAEAVNPPRLAYGQRVEIEARFRTPHNFNNPGAFDYTAYLARRDVFWTALVPSKGAVRVLPGECGSRWRGWVFALRTAALDRIEQLYPDNAYASAMLEATLIGETAHMERVWTEDFRRSGTYHALVISGIHVSVLASVLLALLHFAPISKNSAWAMTAGAAWLYALVSGFTMPVARAAAGFTLYLVARIFFRRVRPLNLLSAIAIGLLAWDPGQSFEASFQLSFLSVAAIGAFAAPLLETSITPLARGLRDIYATSIDPHIEPRAAQLRVELRLIAETIQLWMRVPTGRASGVGYANFLLRRGIGRVVAFGANRSVAADGGILPSHLFYRAQCEPSDRAADEFGGAVRFPGAVHGMALGGEHCGHTAALVGECGKLARGVGTCVARAESSHVASALAGGVDLRGSVRRAAELVALACADGRGRVGRIAGGESVGRGARSRRAGTDGNRRRPRRQLAAGVPARQDHADRWRRAARIRHGEAPVQS